MRTSPRRRSAEGGSTSVPSESHPTEAVSIVFNCAFCTRQRASGQTIDQCPHHFYPSVPVESAAKTDAVKRNGLFKKKLLSTSMSSTNLAELDLHSLQIDRLFTSAAKGDLETIEWLMLSGVNVWQNDAEGRNIMHIAAAQGRIRIVEFLISQNGDVNAEDVWGYTPIACALNNGHFSVAELLVANGANKPSIGSRTDLCLKVCLLASQGCLDEIKIYAARGADMSLGDYDHRTPLHLAASEGHLSICKYLLEVVGVPIDCIDRFGSSPLQGAMDNNRLSIVHYLQERGATITDIQSKVVLYKLSQACADQNFDQIKTLVESDSFDVNLTDYDGRTLLHLAVIHGHSEIVSYLLSKGAKTDILDKWGADCYHEAARRNFREIMHLLDPDNNCPLKQASPLDDLSNDLGKDDLDNCCLRFGQRRSTIHTALLLAVEFIVSSSTWAFGEIWTANRHRLALQCCHDAFSVPGKHDDAIGKKLNKFHSANASLLVESSVFFAGAPIRNGKSVWIEDLRAISQAVFFCAPMARSSGLFSAATIPVRVLNSSDQFFAFAVLFKDCPSKKSEAELLQAENVLAMTSSLLVACAQLHDDDVSRVGYLETVSSFLQNYSDERSSIAMPSRLLEFMMQLLIRLRIVEQFVSWGKSMISEDHKASMLLLLWLVKHVKSCESIADQLVSVFRYLYTVSPLMESESPIRNQADHALDDLREAGFAVGRLPFFGPGKEWSPVFPHITALKKSLAKTYQQSKCRQIFESEFFPPPERSTITLSSGEAFDASGSHCLPSPVARSRSFNSISMDPVISESDLISELCTNMLRTLNPSELITSSSLLQLHKCLDLEAGTSKGEFRSGLVVGSHMFYKFYRVFAPADEVPELIRLFEDELRATSVRMPPVMHAYYVFAVIVCYIHPFEDGNGRVGRIMANMILKSYGYPPVFRSNHKVITFDEVMDLVIQERQSP